ncbi:MAG: hypothetical protein SFW65_10365 [Alphaproteobacteria bacterium]|nr:hypothetical protein [Alphaproteobacteria bacterium]
MTTPQLQARPRRLAQRVAPAVPQEHEVVQFPGVMRTSPAKQVSAIAAEQNRLWRMAFNTYQEGATLESIARTFAELDRAIRDPKNEVVDTSVENGSSVKTAAINAHANAFSNLSYMAQDLKNNGRVEEGEALSAVLKTAKANREAPDDVPVIQMQRPDPDRAIKDAQAQQQQLQL